MPFLESTEHPLRVAIIGAGIAGLSQAISLRHYYPASKVEITIYEKARELTEVGASIGIHTSGLKILEKIGVPEALDPELCIRQSSGAPIAFRHYLTDEVLGMAQTKNDNVEAKYRPGRFHRAHLQQLLVNALPKDVELKLATRMAGTKIDTSSNDRPVVLTFEDGTEKVADILLGADGVYSQIRKEYVPDAEVRWTGMICFRSAFEQSRVAHIKDLPQQDAVRWSGPDDRNLVAGKLGKGLYAIVALHNCDPNDRSDVFSEASWDEETKTEDFVNLYKDWNPTVAGIAKAAPYIKTYPMCAVTPLPSFVFDGRVALIGDAAHAHGGGVAIGGSLAINDSYAFTRALLRVWPNDESTTTAAALPTQEQWNTILNIYDETRRPLTNALLRGIHATAKKRRVLAETKTRTGKGETDEQLRARIEGRADLSWLTEHDVDKEFERVAGKVLGQPVVAADLG